MKISINARNKNLVMREVKLTWKNFDGHGTKANPAGGVRGFGVIINGGEDQDVMEQRDMILDAGLTLKEHPESTPEEPIFVLPVAIRYHSGDLAYLNPVIVEDKINGSSFEYTEETINLLQSAIISDVKVSIHPSHWENNGRSGVKAYLASMHFSLVPRDDFVDDYPVDEDPFND